MALKNSMTTPAGLSIPVAYTRVESAVVDPKNVVRFNAMTYNKSPDEFPVVAIVNQLTAEIDPDKPLYAQLYEHLKTKPDWAGAVDC